MSVFTPVSEGQLAAWLKGYSVGAPLALEPIEAGIENTNYFVTTSQGRFVLTLFERLPAAELPFYLELMAHLARHGIPCPAPIADLDERYFSALNGKPAAILAIYQLSGSNAIDTMARALAGEEDDVSIGVALAAPQIGVSKRIFIVRYDRMEESYTRGDESAVRLGVFINPRIVKTSRKKTETYEGCLSVRHFFGKTMRYERATVRARGSRRTPESRPRARRWRPSCNRFSTRDRPS